MELNGRMMQHQLLTRSAAAGSMVLLRNVNNTLPLIPPGTEPMPVAIFGVGQVHTVNAYKVTPWGKSSIRDGLKSAQDIKIDGLLARKYDTHLQSTMEELPVTNLSMEEFSAENHAAIVVISRGCGNYNTTLTATEQSLIQSVTKSFDRSVLVLNTPNAIEIDEISSLFGAVVFMGIPGQEGGNALADLLTAKAVFSGKLAFDWSEKFPFGYGLGYGTCALESHAMGLDGQSITVTAGFTNISEEYPVREVLQVYFSTPYQSKVLDGFVKTKLLMPGDSQSVIHTFPIWEMSRYDPTKQAFVLDSGYYEIYTATDSQGLMVTGSIFVPKDIVVKQVKSLGNPPMEPISPAVPLLSPEELADIRKCAIRLPMRQIRKKTVSYKETAPLSIQSEDVLTFRNTIALEPLVSSMTDAQLETLVNGSALEELEIPALNTLGGIGGLEIAKTLRDEDGAITARRYLTAFPVPSLLACSFDQELIQSVGQALGKEAKEYNFHLLVSGIDGTVAQGATDCARWSDQPVLAGLATGWFIRGCQTQIPASLSGGDASDNEVLDRQWNWLSFEIAMNVGKPRAYNGNLPLPLLANEWKFKGVHWSTDTRSAMEQSALSQLKLMRLLKL